MLWDSDSTSSLDHRGLGVKAGPAETDSAPSQRPFCADSPDWLAKTLSRDLASDRGAIRWPQRERLNRGEAKAGASSRSPGTPAASVKKQFGAGALIDLLWESAWPSRTRRKREQAFALRGRLSIRRRSKSLVSNPGAHKTFSNGPNRFHQGRHLGQRQLGRHPPLGHLPAPLQGRRRVEDDSELRPRRPARPRQGRRSRLLTDPRAAGAARIRLSPPSGPAASVAGLR